MHFPATKAQPARSIGNPPFLERTASPCNFPNCSFSSPGLYGVSSLCFMPTQTDCPSLMLLNTRHPTLLPRNVLLHSGYSEVAVHRPPSDPPSPVLSSGYKKLSLFTRTPPCVSPWRFCFLIPRLTFDVRQSYHNTSSFSQDTAVSPITDIFPACGAHQPLLLESPSPPYLFLEEAPLMLYFSSGILPVCRSPDHLFPLTPLSQPPSEYESKQLFLSFSSTPFSHFPQSVVC